MKKIFSLLLTLTMVLSLAACGGNSSTPSTPSEDGTQSDAANSDTMLSFCPALWECPLFSPPLAAWQAARW